MYFSFIAEYRFVTHTEFDTGFGIEFIEFKSPIECFDFKSASTTSNAINAISVTIASITSCNSTNTNYTAPAAAATIAHKWNTLSTK